MSKSVNVWGGFTLKKKRSVHVALCAMFCVEHETSRSDTSISLLKIAQHQNEQTSFSVLRLLYLV